MASRDDFLESVWTQIINDCMSGTWIDQVMRGSQQRPDDPFADLGEALQRLLAAGVDRRDLSLIARHARYEASFGLLYMLEDPGVDDGEMLHESLLSADPSGLDGRPGSAP